ncbi:MFS-type transporter SLC18B1-like [Sycon ciliatum]|uniref:MFS-type transporter SLC18B1-like n=1 Tax=Sycon ciliatum TaxID=27933 RepID=UPI0020ABE723|eukprot:scpid95339/ scgid11960/ MFS-type transporter SLC18B1; Solute carrier family 18 member B1
MAETAASSGHSATNPLLKPLQAQDNDVVKGDDRDSMPRGHKSHVASEPDISAVRRFLILATLAAVITAVDLTSFGAFFTTVALSKNANGGADYHMAVGAVFTMLQAGCVLSAPFVTRDLPYIGSKYMMALSIATMGAVQVIFAFVDRIADWRVFLVYCYIIRAIQGVGYSGVSISTSSYITQLYPNNVGFVNGFMFTFTYVGHAAGMFLGGVLFEAGGFPAPFLLSGPAMLCCAVAVMVVIVDIGGEVDADGDISEKHISVRVILRQPWIWVLMVTVALSPVPYSGIESVLGLHMRSVFGSRAISVGGVLSTKIAVGALSCPVIGYALDLGYSAHVSVFVSFLLTGTACLLLGPASFLHLGSSLWLVFLSVIPMAVGHTAMTVSSIYAMTQHLQRVGVGSAVQVRVAIAGISRVCQSSGYGLGPLLTTPLVALLDFRTTWTVYGLIYLALGVVFAVLSCLYSVRHGHSAHKRTSDSLAASDSPGAVMAAANVSAGSRSVATENIPLNPR